MWEVPFQPSPSPQHTPVQYLLPEAKAQDSDKICVVIDLDETLVHSSFKVGPAQHLSACSLLREGACAGRGRSLPDAHPWGSLPASPSNPSFLPASEQCRLYHPGGD